MTAVGEPISIRVEKLIHGGRGLGRWAGMPVFVDGVLRDEEIDARITAVRKGYCEAALTRVVTGSSQRVEPPCPVFSACGGCRLQHAGYDAQLEAKRGIVVESLRRLGGITIEHLDVVPSPEVFGYRLRAGLKIGTFDGQRVLGFYAAGSHAVVPVSSCLVLHPRLQSTLAPLTDLIRRPDRRLIGLDAIEVQTTSSDERVAIVLHSRSFDRRTFAATWSALRETLPLGGLIAYDRRRHRWVGGSDALEEQSNGFRCRVSDRTFLQINAGINAALVAAVVDWSELTGRERVVDLYAGFGNFSLPLARRASRVTAVEALPAAVKDARLNARAHGQENLTIVSSPIESWPLDPADRGPDVAVVDPPRSGLSRDASDRLIALAPHRILYVSCEPATLSRDTARLERDGYHLVGVRGFDMFPHTAHVELLARFERIATRSH